MRVLAAMHPPTILECIVYIYHLPGGEGRNLSAADISDNSLERRASN